MKTHFRNKSKYCSTGASNHNASNNNSSSSGAVEVSTPLPTTNIRSVADVVDSSDEHYMRTHYRGDWNREINQQTRRTSTTASHSINRPKTNVGRSNQHHSKKSGSERHCRDNLELDLGLEDEETNEQLLAGDYKLMSEMPVSIGGHFQFASEKQWTAADSDEQSQLERTEASEYFTLNLKLLNLGLQTIPFYKRLDYPASLFTRAQVESMEKVAEAAETAYQPVLEDHLLNPRSVKVPKKKQSSDEQAEQKAEGKKEEKKTSMLDELDELLNMTDTAANSTAGIKTTAGSTTPDHNMPGSLAVRSKGNINGSGTEANKSDIQEWLDNVLEK